jgi:hypothetical protein
MAVKNIETNEVHIGSKGGKTDCNFDTTKHPDNWVNTTEAITCGRNGCKK